MTSQFHRLSTPASLSLSAELGRQPIEAAPQRNPFMPAPLADVMPDIDGVSVIDLVERHGSPLFVFSERTLASKCAEMRKAFETRHKKTEYAWSYKTNHLRAICRAFKARGWLADVASAMELHRAFGIGYQGPDIVVNGPAKDRSLLDEAMSAGALVQIDNWDELRLVEEIASGFSTPVAVGIRVCLDAGIRPIWTKFGFLLATGEALEAARRICEHPKLKLHTLHTHIGTYVLSPDAYRVATRKLLALRDAVFLETGQLVPCVNLGGGFPSDSLLHGMVGPVERAVPRIDAYAEAICGQIGQLPPAKRPLLRLEAGRHLIDNAGYLLTTVRAIKGSRQDAAEDAPLSGYAHKERLLSGTGAQHGYVVDAGINLLYTAAWFRIDAFPTTRRAAAAEAATLYGPLCMSIDVVREAALLPRLEVGDTLALHPVGAYNFNHSMQFIYERPAAVLIREDGSPELARRRETLHDLEAAEDSSSPS
jgi:diaminopimelate decarboxylase